MIDTRAPLPEAGCMRIHIQNDPSDPLFAITRAQWDAACARAGEDAHDATMGSTPEDFRAVLPDVEAMVIATNTVRTHFPANAPKLRILSCVSAGLDRLAPFDWLPDGVTLLNNSGTHGEKAGEYVLMAMLMLANRMPEIGADQREGRWVKRHGGLLRGRRVTVVGLGDLGGSAAEQAARFGMIVTGVRTRAVPHPACARVVAVDALEGVLPQTDILVLATPLTAATRDMMTRARLALLPAGAAVINIGRGALIDQDALCDMLDAETLSGAVLDVFVPEPVPAGHRLWSTKNLVMTPHVSCDDPAIYNERSLDIFLANLRAYRIDEELPNRFDTIRGY
jgi:glyoxylate/hydroxypyruvate reductase